MRANFEERMTALEEKVIALKNNIDATNEIFAFLDNNGTRVSVLNETPLMKEYAMEHVVDGIHCARKIKFCGTNVQIDEIWNFEKSGYMSWKWGWVRNALEKQIKKQEKAQTRAIKKQHRAQKRAETMMNLRKKLAERVFGDNSL